MTIDQETKKIFANHRQHLLESRRLAYEQFDKAIFLLSGGGLTISLTLIERIIPFTTSLNKPALATAWSFFTISILCTLSSFIASQKALDIDIKKVDDFFTSGDQQVFTGKNRAAGITRNLNISSLICFLIAVAALIWFVFVNIS